MLDSSHRPELGMEVHMNGVKRKPWSIALTDTEKDLVAKAAEIKGEYPAKYGRDVVLKDAQRIVMKGAK